MLVLCKYGLLAASTRLRYVQYRQALAREGIFVHISPLLDDVYLRARFERNSAPLPSIARGFLRRIFTTLTAWRWDLIVITYELASFLPAFLERYIARIGTPYVYDFDDAVFVRYKDEAAPVVRYLFGDKMPKIIRRSAGVIAGSNYLARYAQQFSRRVLTLPTVVDTERYHPREAREWDGTIHVGWIGSPSTSEYLPMLFDSFRRLSQTQDLPKPSAAEGSERVERPESRG